MQFHIWALLSLLTLTIASPLPTTSLSPVNPLNKDDLSALDDLSKRQTPLNVFLGLLLDYLPAINGPVEAVSGILTSFEQLLAFLTQQKTTYNELDGACKEFTVLFARGTTEPGNVGILVGPPFFEALREKVGSRRLAIQGVNGYDADVEGYLDGGDAGGITMM
jgi:cutinase